MTTPLRPIVEETINTEDGWELKAYHHQRDGSTCAPVLVFHAMSLSAYTLNGNKGVPSIAKWLGGKEFDVWVCECRGVGKSMHPEKGKRAAWTFDDHLIYDVPAFLTAIQKATARNKFHWIGHSMGGALLLAHLCTTNDSRIKSGIIAGSGFEGSDRIGSTEIQIRLLDFFRIQRIPLRMIARLSKPFFKMIPDNYSLFSKKLTGYNTCITIMDDIHDIPAALLMYALKSYRKGGFRSRNDTLIYSDKAKNITTPLLFISGNMDLAWTPPVVRKNLEYFSKGIAEMLSFGKEYGHADNYGHVDIMMGKNAEYEVFPEMLHWIKEKENAG